MPVITMSGNIASGAREVGIAAARLLGIDFVDQQLMVEAAQRCGVTLDTLAEHDERRGSLKERLAAMLRTFLERSAASGADPLSGAPGLDVLLSRTYAEMAAEQESQLTDELYLKTVTVIIQELAARGDVVILGRGSQMILRDHPGVLHVLCIAPRELRAQRLAEREGIGLEEASRRTAESDRARAAFYQKFWKVDIRDPALYDLTLNTARMTYETAAELVAIAARARSGAAAGAAG